MVSIPIPMKGEPHDFLVEAGLVGGIGRLVEKVLGKLPTTVVADAAVSGTVGATVAASLQQEGVPVGEVIPVQAEETAKTLETAGHLYDAFLAQRLDRGGAVIAVGGGLVCDLAGFAASTYKRGVPFMLVPTTLLAMVDASIGGKTAVNRPLPGGGLGRNLVGTFALPRAIAADPSTLGSLPDRELRCGLAECVKHAMVGDPTLLAVLERDGPALLARDAAALHALIERSVAIKIRIVVEDPHERGRRAELNLGHTFAHAIESDPGLGLRHGEAVSIGLVAAARLSAARGLLPATDADRVERLLSRFGLPTRLPRRPDRVALMRAMVQDKKASAGRMRLVLPRAIGRVEVVEDAGSEEVSRAWESVGG